MVRPERGSAAAPPAEEPGIEGILRRGREMLSSSSVVVSSPPTLGLTGLMLFSRSCAAVVSVVADIGFHDGLVIPRRGQ